MDEQELCVINQEKAFTLVRIQLGPRLLNPAYPPCGELNGSLINTVRGRRGREKKSIKQKPRKKAQMHKNKMRKSFGIRIAKS